MPGRLSLSLYVLCLVDFVHMACYFAGSGCIKNEEQDQHLYTNLIVGEASMHGSVAVLAICLCFEYVAYVGGLRFPRST